MTMKRVLIIQTDDMYFLHETLQVLTANSRDMEDVKLTLLVGPKSREVLEKSGVLFPEGTTTDIKEVLSSEYDLSFNLSLNEAAWQIHGDVKAEKKAGAFYQGNELMVNGVWSAWFLTFKGNTPFVTFHMREIFRQILGLKKRAGEVESSTLARTMIMGLSNPEFFTLEEQEAFVSGIVRRFPGLQVLDESEVNSDHDHTHSLYIGPASMKALTLCESGARAVIIGSRFQGLNLLPEKEGTLLITTGGKKIDAQSLLGVIEILLKEKEARPATHLNIYRLSMENVFGAYLENLTGQEMPFPFYQAHLVLWNYLLALQDVNLDIVPPSQDQREMIEGQLEIVTKLLRLHDYAMVGLDAIYKEAKLEDSDA
ncbi:MAG: hypothetical protein ACJ76H_04280, partial [Bacteriovoracaceae bacterium]